LFILLIVSPIFALDAGNKSGFGVGIYLDIESTPI
jgi:hypothetical protein